MKNLQWETLDLPDSFEGVNENLLPYYIEKFTQCVEMNLATSNNEKFSGRQGSCKRSYIAWRAMNKNSRLVDVRVNSVTYDIIAKLPDGTQGRVEWKNPYGFSSLKVKQLGENFWFALSPEYPDAVLRRIPMVPNLGNLLAINWKAVIPKEIEDDLTILVLKARELRSKLEVNELTEDDLTTEFWLNIWAESGVLRDELEYNPSYKFFLEKEKKEVVLSKILMSVSKAHDFAKKHAEDPRNIERFIPVNETGTSSFNRDDDPTNHNRLPRIIPTLPDRKFKLMEEWGDEGSEIFKFFDSFEKEFPDGRKKTIVYEIGAEDTLKKVFSNLERVKIHTDMLREYQLVFALNTSLKRMDEDAFLESLENYRASSTLDDDTLDKLIEMISHPKIGNEKRKEILTEFLGGIGAKFQEETGILVDKSGELLLNTEECKLKNKRKGKTVDMKVRKPARIQDYEQTIISQVQNHDQGVDSKWDIMKGLEAYGHEGMDALSRILLDKGTNRLEEIVFSKWYGLQCQIMMYYKDILLNGNSGKSVSTNGFRIIPHKNRGFYTLKTNDTSKITTGTMWNFGAFEIEDENNFKFPDIYGEFEYIVSEGLCYFCSKPFTMNVEVLNKPFFSIAAWIATMLTMTEEMQANERETFYEENVILHSLFWDYNANIRHILTAINFLYKLPLSTGFFGKFEMEGRLDKYVIKDARAATIMYRLRQNWPNFLDELRLKSKENPKLSVSEVLRGVKDPLFGFQHKSAMTLNNVGFLKNILLKDDGVDELKFLSSQYKVERSHYVDDYLQSDVVNMWSKFEAKSLTWANFSDEFDAFTKALFKNLDDERPKWAPVSFYPEVIAIMTNDLYDQVEKINPRMKQGCRRWINELAIASEKQSKVNLFDSRYTEELMKSYLKEKGLKEAQLVDEDFIEYCARKGALVGMRSFDLPTAMKLEIKKMADFLSFYTENEGRPFYAFDKGPKLLHLAMYGLSKYGDSCVVTEHMKLQVGDLRVFFMQELSMRNGNRVIDKLHSSILQDVPEDLIMKRGDRKLLKIEEMSRKVKDLGIPNPMIISCDQKRYGDTYPMESLLVKIDILLERGIINRHEFMVFKRCLLLIKNRYVILNPKVRAFMKKFDMKRIDPIVSLSANSRELLGELQVIFKDQIKSEDFQSYTNHELLQLITKNKGLKKGVGWILGVMNMFSSVDTSLHLKTVIDCISSFVIGDPVLTGGTHSDDEIIVTSLPTVSIKEFKEMTNLMKALPDIVANKEKFNVTSSGLISIQNGRKFQLKELSVLILTLSIYSPRFFGQRPSLAKWVWGTSGEVLQTTVQGGSSTQPISKWLTVFARELPFESPGADLQHMIAQVIPSLKHGASEELMACSFILVNKILNFIYPDLAEHRQIDVPPELGGFWWCIPSMIKECGFAANELRLYTLSKKSKELIKLMSKTSPLWERKDTPGDETKQYEVHSRMDLKIVFSVYTNTDKNIQELVKRLNLEEQLREIGFDSFFANLKEYTARTKATRLKQGKTVDNNTFNYLARVYSPSFQRRLYKIKPSKALIATFGYLNRKFKNPFKQQFYDGSIISYAEWRETILQNLDVVKISDKAINLFERVYQGDIILHNHFPLEKNEVKVKFYTKKEIEERIGWLFKLKYLEVTASREGYYPDFAKAVILVCHDLMDQIPRVGETMDRIRLTETYLYNQEVCEEPGFATAVETWLNNFRELQLKADDLIEVYDFLVSVLSSTYALDILKRFRPNVHVLFDSWNNMFSTFDRIEINSESFSTRIREISDSENEEKVAELLKSANAYDEISTSKESERLLKVLSWIKKLHGKKTDELIVKIGDDFEITERDLITKISDVSLANLGDGIMTLKSDYLSKRRKNQFLFKELFLKSAGEEEKGYNLKFYRCKIERTKGENTEELHGFALKMSNKYILQSLFENYKGEEDTETKVFVSFGLETKEEPTVEDLEMLGPMVEIMNYYLISIKTSRFWMKSKMVHYNRELDEFPNLKFIQWPEGFAALKNSDLNPTFKIHFGCIFPLQICQQGEYMENGVHFSELYRKVFWKSANKLIQVNTKSIILSSYNVMPWVDTTKGLNMKIVDEDGEVLYSDIKGISKTTDIGAIGEDLQRMYPFVIKDEDLLLGADDLLNMCSIIDTYIINLNGLNEICSPVINRVNAFSISEKQTLTLAANIKELAKSVGNEVHNDLNARNVFLNGLKIIRDVKVLLGELIRPDLELIRDKNDRDMIKGILPSTVIFPENSSLALTLKATKKANISKMGKFTKLDPVSKFHLIQPRVMLISYDEYFKRIFEYEGAFQIDSSVEYSSKVFNLMNTRGNFEISMMSDLCVGMATNDRVSTLFKQLMIKKSMSWTKTRIRISVLLSKLLNKIAKGNTKLMFVINSVELIEF